MNCKLALAALLASSGTGLFAGAQQCPPKPTPIRDIRFHDLDGEGLHGYELHGNARIVEPAPDGIPRALRIDQVYSHALLKGLDIGPEAMPEVTISVSAYIESIRPCPGCNVPDQNESYGWVISHDNNGWDRAIFLHDERFNGMGMTSGQKPKSKFNLTPTLQKWIHIIGVWRQGGECALYIENEKVPFTQTVIGRNNEGLPDVAIGAPQRRDFGRGNDNDFWIKDVKIFDYALSDEEIKSLDCHFEQDLDPTLDCGQGGDLVYSCSECVAGDGSASGCAGDCVWRPEIPHCVQKDDTDNNTGPTVSCGDHDAADCSQCDVSSNGPSGCSGECKFDAASQTCVDDDYVAPTPTPDTSCPVNIALGGVASQSSNYADGGAASLAIDGKTSSNWHDRTMSHTNRYSKNPWWKVKFAKKPISSVTIFNRQDCCSDRIVGFIMEIFDGSTKVYSSEVSAKAESSTDKSSYNFDIPHIVGDTVKVRLTKNIPLHMAEVIVMSDPCATPPPPTCESRNIALSKNGGVASQSSNYHDGGAASLAIDGKTGQSYYGDKTMSHTSSNSRNPWWKVKFAKQSISSVTIFNRQDCCTDRIVGFIMEIFDGSTKVYSSEVSAKGVSSTDKSKYEFAIPNITGDTVKVRLPGTVPLHMAEVQVMSDSCAPPTCALKNIALGGVASQSSNYADGGAASLAIDGKTSSNFYDRTMSHTSRYSKNPWWKVKFAKQSISSVTILNREDCCGDRIVGFIMEIFDGPTKVYSSEVSAKGVSSTDKSSYKFDIPRIVGDTVKVRLTKDIPLHMAEVQVMSDSCTSGPPPTCAAKNIALSKNGGVASQSSNYADGGAASLAIDGKTSSNFYDRTMSHTSRYSKNPWWKVKFAKKSISSVTILNREDCCGDRIVGFIMEIFNGSAKVYSSEVSAKAESSTDKSSYKFDIPNVIGDSVKVRLTKNIPLHMAEVQVISTSCT